MDVFNSNGEADENALDLPPAAETVVTVTPSVEEESRDVRAGVLRYLIKLVNYSCSVFCKVSKGSLGTSAEVVLKKYQVPGTVPSGNPPKSEPYQTVPCRTMQWKSVICVPRPSADSAVCVQARNRRCSKIKQTNILLIGASVLQYIN